MTATYTRGVVFVHSAPPALCPHLEWLLATVLERDVSLEWSDQPAAAGMKRCEYAWSGLVGTGARIASALRGWEHLRYEITEEPMPGSEGARWCHTPDLGIFHAPMDCHGNLLIPEDRVRAALAGGRDLASLRDGLELALGQAWDDELEPFRYAGEGVAVRWLHRVG